MCLGVYKGRTCENTQTGKVSVAAAEGAVGLRSLFGDAVRNQLMVAILELGIFSRKQ